RSAETASTAAITPSVAAPSTTPGPSQRLPRARRPPASGRWPLRKRGPFSTGATGVHFRPALTRTAGAGGGGFTEVASSAVSRRPTDDHEKWEASVPLVSQHQTGSSKE